MIDLKRKITLLSFILYGSNRPASKWCRTFFFLHLNQITSCSQPCDPILAKALFCKRFWGVNLTATPTADPMNRVRFQCGAGYIQESLRFHQCASHQCEPRLNLAAPCSPAPCISADVHELALSMENNDQPVTTLTHLLFYLPRPGAYALAGVQPAGELATASSN